MRDICLATPPPGFVLFSRPHKGREGSEEPLLFHHPYPQIRSHSCERFTLSQTGLFMFSSFVFLSVVFFFFFLNFRLESLHVVGELFLCPLPPQALLPLGAPASHPITGQAIDCTLFLNYNDPLPFLFQFQGEAGASSPRSIKNRSSGHPVKMAAKAASPATLVKKRKKSLSLCKGPPCQRHRVLGQPSEGNQGQHLFLLPTLFSWCFFLFFLLYLLFENRNGPIEGSSPHLGFEFEAFLHLPSVNASNSPCILLEFSLRQLQFALQDEFGEVNRGTGHITHAGNTIG